LLSKMVTGNNSGALLLTLFRLKQSRAANGNDPFTPMAPDLRLALDDWSAAGARPRRRSPDGTAKATKGWGPQVAGLFVFISEKLAMPSSAEAPASATEAGESRAGATEAMELLASPVELREAGAWAEVRGTCICGAALNEAAEPAAGVSSKACSVETLPESAEAAVRVSIQAGVRETLVERAEAAVRASMQAGRVETLLEGFEAAIRVSIQARRVETPVEITEFGAAVWASIQARSVQTLMVEAAEVAIGESLRLWLLQLVRQVCGLIGFGLKLRVLISQIRDLSS
jgi:hypothetical protein